MIRVLHMIGSLDVGGSQTMIMNIYRRVDKNKIQFDFIVDHPDQLYFAEEIKKMGGKIYFVPSFKGTNIVEIVKVWNDFFNIHREYHILHSHVRSYAVIYLLIAKKYGLITIAHSHSTSNGSGFPSIVKNIMQLPIRYIADYLFACSDKAGVWLYGKKALTKSNYQMIPNGVDLERFAFDKSKRQEIREQLGIKTNEIVIGHIGRFTEPKNHKFLVELFEEYHKKNPNSRLLMVGDGELYETVRKQCDELGIAESVIMTGSRTDTENFYQAMDVFVFPSLWEGLPVAVVEAQANGLPCLISDVITRDVNLTDLISYLQLADKKVWINFIDKVMEDERMEVSDENRMKLQLFDSKKVAQKLEKFYLEQDKKGRK